jgi:hypothetical protein
VVLQVYGIGGSNGPFSITGASFIGSGYNSNASCYILILCFIRIQ